MEGDTQSRVVEAEFHKHSFLKRVAEADLCEDIPFLAELRKRNHHDITQSVVAEAELREDIRFWAEMRKRNFTVTLPPSGVVEEELRDDTPLNSMIVEAELCKSFSS